MNITSTDVNAIENIFQKYGYTSYHVRAPYEIPALYVQNFPKNLNSIKDEKTRREFFIRLLAPLVLKVNERIGEERRELEEIRQKLYAGEKPDRKQIDRLEQLAVKYDVFTRLKAPQRYKRLADELIVKVDIVPPSIVVGVAAIETDWGNSRIAPEGNALFKELVWHTDEGLKPKDEDKDESYRIKVYPDMYRAIEAFALKLNSNVNYANMRDLRKHISRREKLVDGRTMAHTMLFNSPLENYIGMLDYVITFYGMIDVDKAVLQEKIKKNDAVTKI